MAVAVLVPFTFSHGAGLGADPARRHLHRRHLWRRLFRHPAQHAGHAVGDRHHLRRLSDGQARRRRSRRDARLLSPPCLAAWSARWSLLLLAPPLASVALAFGPVEYFWLAIFGLSLIASLSDGQSAQGTGRRRLRPAAVHGRRRRVSARHPLTFGSPRCCSAASSVCRRLIGLYCMPVLIDLVATPERHLKVEEGGRAASGLREAVAHPGEEPVQPRCALRSSARWSASCPAPAARSRGWWPIPRPSARRSARSSIRQGRARRRHGHANPPTTPPSAAASSRRWCSAFPARRPTPSSSARCWCRASAPARRCSRRRSDRLHLHLRACSSPPS